MKPRDERLRSEPSNISRDATTRSERRAEVRDSVMRSRTSLSSYQGGLPEEDFYNRPTPSRQRISPRAESQTISYASAYTPVRRSSIKASVQTVSGSGSSGRVSSQRRGKIPLEFRDMQSPLEARHSGQGTTEHDRSHEWTDREWRRSPSVELSPRFEPIDRVHQIQSQARLRKKSLLSEQSSATNESMDDRDDSECLSLFAFTPVG